MAIRATEIDNNSTIEQLRVQFNNLITDVTAIESGTLNLTNVAATTISVGDLTVTGAFSPDL